MSENTSPLSVKPETPLLSSIQDFLFGAPLYAKYSLSDKTLSYWFVKPLVVDGHCADCQKTATFHRSAGVIPIQQLPHSQNGSLILTITCTRHENHQIRFWLQINLPSIQKLGQYPSLADIANDESRTYRQVLSRNDGAELHRAIGLAAHGVGVGSFVYLRRVFERLIAQRFDDFREKEGWSADDFVGKRMEEKIELLQHHLPDFLVRNKKVYAILSKGIHELEDSECLGAFEMLKHAIFFILDEDKHKKEELDLRRKAEKAIATFSADKDAAADDPTTPK